MYCTSEFEAQYKYSAIIIIIDIFVVGRERQGVQYPQTHVTELPVLPFRFYFRLNRLVGNYIHKQYLQLLYMSVEILSIIYFMNIILNCDSHFEVLKHIPCRQGTLQSHTLPVTFLPVGRRYF